MSDCYHLLISSCLDQNHVSKIVYSVDSATKYFTSVDMLTYSQSISKLMGFSLMVIVLYPWHSFCCQMTKQNRWQFPGSSGKLFVGISQLS